MIPATVLKLLETSHDTIIGARGGNRYLKRLELDHQRCILAVMCSGKKRQGDLEVFERLCEGWQIVILPMKHRKIKELIKKEKKTVGNGAVATFLISFEGKHALAKDRLEGELKKWNVAP